MEQNEAAVRTTAADGGGAGPMEGRTPLSCVAKHVVVVTGTAVILGALFGSWGCALAAAFGGLLKIATQTRANWRYYGRAERSASAANSPS